MGCIAFSLFHEVAGFVCKSLPWGSVTSPTAFSDRIKDSHLFHNRKHYYVSSKTVMYKSKLG